MIRSQKTQAIEQALYLPSYNCVTTAPKLAARYQQARTGRARFAV